MELVTTYRFKSGQFFVGIVGKKDPMILKTTNVHSAVHHFAEEFDWVCRLLNQAQMEYTVDKMEHLYHHLKYSTR